MTWNLQDVNRTRLGIGQGKASLSQRLMGGVGEIDPREEICEGGDIVYILKEFMWESN